LLDICIQHFLLNTIHFKFNTIWSDYKLPILKWSRRATLEWNSSGDSGQKVELNADSASCKFEMFLLYKWLTSAPRAP
jgi:glutathionylspermidine synthase